MALVINEVWYTTSKKSFISAYLGYLSLFKYATATHITGKRDLANHIWAQRFQHYSTRVPHSIVLFPSGPFHQIHKLTVVRLPRTWNSVEQWIKPFAYVLQVVSSIPGWWDENGCYIYEKRLCTASNGKDKSALQLLAHKAGVTRAMQIIHSHALWVALRTANFHSLEKQ